MRFFLIIVFLFFAVPVFAHQPSIVTPVSYDDLTIIKNPEVSQSFYGELDGFPHTFEFTVAKPIQLDVQVLEPDSKTAAKNHSGIVIRERDNGRGVEEIARLRPGEALWNSSYEPFGGDRYIHGPEYSGEIRPGVYRIEVSTLTNAGKYVLSVGKIEDFSNTGYFETVAGIYKVKRFLGKPPISIIGTPFVYVPLIIVLILALVGRIIYKRRYA